MKRLIQIMLIMLAVTAIGAVISIFQTNKYDTRVAIAYENGYAEGQAQGRQAGSREGSETGYQEGSKVGYALSRQESAVGSYRTDFYFVYNPTYEEAMALLRKQGNSSALEVHEYAEAHGLRSAYTRVEINRQADEGKVWVYYLVAFDTIDRGLVVIEPRTLKTVQMETGQGFLKQNGFPSPPDEDIITRVTFIW